VIGVAVATGLIIGLLMGFIDTYGYAITGYTTAELSPIISSVLIYATYVAVFRRKPALIEHFLATTVAAGFSLSTTITSGMYITYTMLSRVVSPESIELPRWTYFKDVVDVDTIAFYLFATSITASGILMAYVFHRHFIEREKLPYPIGVVTALTLTIVKLLRSKNVLIPLLTGFTLELLFLTLAPPAIDLTPMVQLTVPGASLALSLDIMVFLIALLMPLNTSLGVGVGNLVMYSLATPYLVYLGLLYTLPSMTAQDLAVAAAPLTASVLVGFIAVAVLMYLIQDYRGYITTFKYLRIARYELRAFTYALVILCTTLIPPIVINPKGINPLTLLVIVFLIPLYILITLMTIRVVGETGTASQSTLPLVTLTLFASGCRGAVPYIFLDPYTGVPMPQFAAGTAMSLSKAAKVVGLDSEVVSHTLMLALLLGAPVTLLYGHVLLSVYGVESPKFNLIRWLPSVMWMKALYLGDLSSFNVTAIVVGAVLAAALALLLRLTRLSISLFSIMLGLTLTPDVALIFILASITKYIALRIGTEVYESLLLNTALALAGCGVAIITHVALSIAMPAVF